jgi:RNA polymerase sigma-70 factor, ECF subfamily
MSVSCEYDQSTNTGGFPRPPVRVSSGSSWTNLRPDETEGGCLTVGPADPPTSTCYDEAELVSACREANGHARWALYMTHSERVLALLTRMTKGDRHEASDLSQQVFVKVFDRIGSFRGRSSLGTWIHRIAVNETLQRFRRRQRYEKIAGYFARERTSSCHNGECLATAIDVREAVAKLPERLREMVRLRYYEGLACGQIAESLGVKAGTVASGLHRARRRLKDLLSSHEVLAP